MQRDGRRVRRLRVLAGCVDADSGAAAAEPVADLRSGGRDGRVQPRAVSSAEFDAALDEALQEFDPEIRNEKLAEATRIPFDEMPVVPLYWQEVHWAAKEGITIDGGLSAYTLPQDVSSTE